LSLPIKQGLFYLKIIKPFKIRENSCSFQIRIAVFLLYKATGKPLSIAEAMMETYLTIEELADYLKLAEQTIRRWVLNREIPFHKIKKVIRFRVSEIEAWIDEDGWKIPAGNSEVVEIDMTRDVISLDELAEMEQADEMPDTEEDE
jgi:excisionase family DNA binding protein